MHIHHTILLHVRSSGSSTAFPALHALNRSFSPKQGQKMLDGKAGMAAALSVMGSSAVSLPALAGLPHSGPSLLRLSEAAEGSDFGSSILTPGAALLSYCCLSSMPQKVAAH